MHRRAAAAVALGLLFVVGVASTATNVIEASRAGQQNRPITANELKPPECADLDLLEIRVAGRQGGAGCVREHAEVSCVCCFFLKPWLSGLRSAR